MRLAPGTRSRSSRARPGSRLQRSRRARLRRWVAALFAGLAVVVGVSALRPADATGSGLPTVVAARAIPAGAVIAAADVRLEARRAEHRPESAASDPSSVVGRRAAGPIEPKGVVTAERLAGAGLLAGRSDGRVAMTVPVMPVSLTGVQVGSRVDVYATGTGRQVVAAAQVLAVLGGGGAGSGPGNLTWQEQAEPGITVAVSPSEAKELAAQLSGLSGGESFVLAVLPGG